MPTSASKKKKEIAPDVAESRTDPTRIAPTSWVSTIVLFQRDAARRHLHSFPTRRSSDLQDRGPQRLAKCHEVTSSANHAATPRLEGPRVKGSGRREDDVLD